MNFSGFLGNDEVKARLSAAFALQRFPHAVLLQGERGCGKRMLANLLARALVCRDREHAPCGTCPSCVRAFAGSHPDIRTEEGSGATRSLSVDRVKAVIGDAYRMPEEADVRVYLLFLGTRVSDAVQNKLLKILEEPPSHGMFILVSEADGKLLPTLYSRVQSFTIKPPSLKEAADYGEKVLSLPEKEASELAFLCGGNIGRMREEQEAGSAAQAFSLARKMARAMCTGSELALLEIAAPLQKDRELFREVLSWLRLIFRDACVYRAGGNEFLGGAREEAILLGGLSMKQVMTLPELSEDARQKLERNANMGLLVTEFCARLREASGK